MYARSYRQGRGGYALRQYRGGFSLKGLIRGAGKIAGSILGTASQIAGVLPGGQIAQAVTGGAARALAGGTPQPMSLNTSLVAAGGSENGGEKKKGRRMNAGNARAARRAIRRIKSVRNLLHSIERELPRRPAARGGSRGVITRGEAAHALRS